MRENLEKMIPEAIVPLIHAAGNIVLLSHVHPDGDALGSQLAFASILESLGKNVFCFQEEPVSHLYDFLPEKDKVQTSLDAYRQFVIEASSDIISIALDCGDKYRLGQLAGEFTQVEPFIVIDHHKSHKNFGTSRWVDSERSSTGEMIYELALELKAEISYNCAYNLYVAICTDTGSFKFDCTRPRTLFIAGELLLKGVKPSEVGHYLFENYSRQRLKLLELALSTVELSPDGDVAFMYVSQAMLEASEATLEDVEGFIDFPRSIQTVKVAVFIKEAPDELISVSLRAKGECDVSVIAKQFGGGGHRNAAGLKLKGQTIEQAKGNVAKVLCDGLS